MFWNKLLRIRVFVSVIIILSNNVILTQKTNTKTLDVKEKIATIRKECFDSYKAFFALLSTTSHFKLFTSEQKKLFPKTIDELISVSRNFSYQGSKLLFTIGALSEGLYIPSNYQPQTELEQIQQEQLMGHAQKVLSKVNELFCLKFLCMICNFECSKNTDKILLKEYHTLLNTKIASETATEYPFHGLLAETAITILMVKFSPEQYNTKKESLVYNLGFMLEKILSTNRTLGPYRLNQHDITEFIDLLGQYALKKPIVSPDRVNFLAKTTIAALITGALICYAINKEAPKWLKAKCNEIFGGVMDFLGPNYLGENTIKAVKKDIHGVVDAEQTKQLIETGQQVALALQRANETIKETTATIKPIATTIGNIHWKGVGISLATFLGALSIKAVASCF